MLRQLSIGLDMQSGLVAHVYEISFLRSHLVRKRHGIINRLMRAMGKGTQGIHYQHINSTQGLISCFRSCKHIGHKAQRAYAIAQDRQSTMHHL